MALIESLVLVAILIFLIYKWSTAKFTMLSERGVPHDRPQPLIGNLGLNLMLGKTSSLQVLLDLHKKYKDSKVYGMYSMRDPVIMIRDGEMIKKIGVKDFDKFPNRKNTSSTDENNPFQKSLAMLNDRKWKEMRSTLTPAFTGSKMRLMFELINECCLEGVKYLDKEIKAGEKQQLELEMKDYFTRFANDVIATCAFGIKVNSFLDKNNKFYTTGKKAMTFGGWILFKGLIVRLLPKIAKILRIKAIDIKSANYLNSLVLDAIKYREQHHVVRPDMINLLMEAKKNFEHQSKSQQSEEHAQFTDADLVAQCLLFFFAGFETVSTCLCFTVHELLDNPEAQQKLYEEIVEMEQELDGKPLHYDALKNMKYMDMVMSESLRKWPPAIITSRVSSADYTLTDDDGNVLANLKAGDQIGFPIICLHLDPDNFDNPMKFDPERFSDENKKTINPMTYLPFGVGPRNCIGNRLALMETKSIIYHMLLRFKIVAGAKTTKDMMNSIKGFLMKPAEGFWVKLEPRQK